MPVLRFICVKLNCQQGLIWTCVWYLIETLQSVNVSWISVKQYLIPNVKITSVFRHVKHNLNELVHKLHKTTY